MEELLTRRNVRRHLQHKWKKIRHAMNLQNDIDSQGSSNVIIEHISRKKKTQLIISVRDNLYSLKRLIKFRYIVKSECVTDINRRTLIYLKNLHNPNAIEKATDAINHYYFHILNNPSHQSDDSNTASLHNIDHLKCVNNLLCQLILLSDFINRFIEGYYKSLYEKLSELKWDEHDDPNFLCCLIILGDFKRGELCFSQLQIIIPLRLGQLMAFSSCFLLYGNLPITSGIQHSVVYFVHSTFFHNLHDFSSVYSDFKNRIEQDVNGSIVPTILRQDLNNTNRLNCIIKLDKPKANQI
ncbi:15088_t:CDS:2 [Funneliformis mosseae]|uniref:15088_t:CDS:1 n=1 Tax=Funneliformis mosseae TaxID=27381 RepID=A0A9N9FYJ7_FUNMO|nr:15088_t:CDS:2 [Funneliformis mosseae]